MRFWHATVLAVTASLGCQAAAAPAAHFAALDRTLTDLTAAGRFDGAVVVEHEGRVVFAAGYGLADPFTGRRFTPDTAVDSASLAKPVTAAAVLALAAEGRLDLDAPVRRYLAEFPYGAVTVRHLLTHSAGLPPGGDPAGVTNADLLARLARDRPPPLFAPGARFSYCNLCYQILAELVERTTRQSLLDFARSRLALPDGVAIRPARLTEWQGRAIGFRRDPDGTAVRADSYEDERFYGSANLSVSTRQLAQWGSQWHTPRLSAIATSAAAPALIAGAASGLRLGSWYCAPDGRRCHYLGHHEGFHHMLYRDRSRRLTVAMVTNNSLAPALQQRLQRALVAFAEGRPAAARTELARTAPGVPLRLGTFGKAGASPVTLTGTMGQPLTVSRAGVLYDAFPIGEDVHYVPGRDAYLTGRKDGRLRWLSLYEDELLAPAPAR